MQNVALSFLHSGITVESAQNYAEQQGIEQKRPRRLTMMKLEWLVEKARKIELLKQQIADGSYQVDSHDVAKAMLGLDFEEKIGKGKGSRY